MRKSINNFKKKKKPHSIHVVSTVFVRTRPGGNSFRDSKNEELVIKPINPRDITSPPPFFFFFKQMVPIILKPSAYTVYSG